MSSGEDKIKAVLEAGSEEIWRLIRGQHPDVMSHAVSNRNLTEEMAVFIARSRRVSAEVLGSLSNDVRFKDSYALKLAICRNPKTPQKVTLSLMKHVKLFDLSDLSKDQQINISIRQKIEQMLSERITAMPSGVKTALAKRASSNIVALLMEKGDAKVARACLDSPILTEGQICRIINRQSIQAPVIKAISEHAKWSLRYAVKFSLIRNFYTPMSRVVRFISEMKSTDLRDLYADRKLPLSTRPFIYRELVERGKEPGIEEEEVYSLMEEQDEFFGEIEDEGG